MSDDTLFQRIGGKAAVGAAVNKMYDKILADPDLQPLFERSNAAELRRSQTAFMVMAFGGPHHYTGKDLTRAHSQLVFSRGLTDRHFDAVSDHLKATLIELEIPEDLISEVMTIVAGTRDAVLGRKGWSAAKSDGHASL